MVVTVSELNQFTTNYEDSPEAVSMKEGMLKAAQGVVAQYLGYDPEVHDVHEYLSGFGFDILKLSARPIISIEWLAVNGVLAEWDNIRVNDDTVSLINGVFPHGYNNIEVQYTAGYENVPMEIHQTILSIASLMLQESGGNIGLSGRSFGDTSRSFVNYTDYNKHLRNIAAYRTAIR